MALAMNLKRRILALTKSTKAKKRVKNETLKLLCLLPSEDQPRSKEDIRKIRQYLCSKIYALKNLPADQLNNICRLAVAEGRAKGETLLKFGDEIVFFAMLKGSASVFKQDAQVPDRLIFAGDCENEGRLDPNFISHFNYSSVRIESNSSDTVILCMSSLWAKEAHFLEICRVTGINFPNPAYDKNNFLGRIPERNLKRVLHKCSVRKFSIRSSLMHAASRSEVSIAKPKQKNNEVVKSIKLKGQQHSKSVSSSSMKNTKLEPGPSSSEILNSGAKATTHPWLSYENEVLYIVNGVVQVNWIFEDEGTHYYVPVATFGNKEVIGLLETLYQHPISYQIVAVTAVTAIAIPKIALYQIPQKQLKIAEESSFAMWLSWINQLQRVLKANIKEVCK